MLSSTLGGPEASPEAEAEAEAVPEADPLPEAEAEAEADADPEADAQQLSYPYPISYSEPVQEVPYSPYAPYEGSGTTIVGGDSGSVSVESGLPPVQIASGVDTSYAGVSTLPFPVGGQTSQCSMLDQCCGMVNEGCCIQGQQEVQGEQCYTIYERKCRYSNKPFCQRLTKQECMHHTIKDCRPVQERRTVNVPTHICERVKEKKCFSYTGKECEFTNKNHEKNITWTDHQLNRGATKEVEKCFNVRTCNIEQDMETINSKVPKRECDKIPQPRRVCNTVAVPQPPQTIQTTQYKIEYKQQCYNVPKPVCRQSPGPCVYNVVQENICPIAQECSISNEMPCPGSVPSRGISVYNKAQIGTTDSSFCRMQNVQQCASGPSCEMTTERVCQQVPYRVPVPSIQTRPSPPKYEVKCDTVTDYVERCKTVWVNNPTQIPRSRCKQGVKRQCVKVQVPDSSVVSVDKSEMVSFPTQECNIVDKEKEHCTYLLTNVKCRQKMVPNTVVIAKNVCDQVRTTKQCFSVPHENCVNSPGQECWNVPRQVCQPSLACPKSSYCDKCSQFALSGGFGQCSTSSCPNFVSAPMNVLQG